LQEVVSIGVLFAVILGLLLAIAPRAQAQTEIVLYSFGSEPDGFHPFGPLLREHGNFYGTTEFGGASRLGTVFELTAAGAEKVLYSFTGPDGQNPAAGLIGDAEGNLYGTTSTGGTSLIYGTVFEVTSTGTEKTLYSFTGGADAATPYAGLTRDAQGNLYGTTLHGGNGARGEGTVFEITSAGTEKVLHRFHGADGQNPAAGLTPDAQGNLYGTTIGGGAFGHGTVFVLTSAGAEKVLYSFTGGADGSQPWSGLILDTQGDLYGTTLFGGASGLGTVFEITPAGAENVLYSFSGADGQNPIGELVRDAQANLYGTTQFGGASGGGTVFELTSTGIEKVLYGFTGGTDGSEPVAGVIRDPQGNLYGTTENGGASGVGTIFEVIP
jgi:uncharacterized repeat protein (TIGR03803 family)